MDGVPTRLWLDIAPAMVKKVPNNGDRVRPEKFLRLNNHHGFSIAPCDLCKGNEKRNEECKAGYYRPNVFLPGLQIDDLKALNLHFLEQYDQDMLRSRHSKQCLHSEVLQDNQKDLTPLPFVSFYESELKVGATNSYAKFTLNRGKSTYPTAFRYANNQVFAKLTAHEVIVFDKNYREITWHLRLYGDHEQESMDWLPYLAQLSRRLVALKYTGIYPMLPREVQSS